MKLTRRQLSSIIRESLSLHETHPGHGDADGDGVKDFADSDPGGGGDVADDDSALMVPTEENQEPVVVAYEALSKALAAVKALEAVASFNIDSRITTADIDNKIHYINRSWRKTMGE